jgi:hypothetical protein|tara:strand:- start:2071 stop:2400 length:330 start_codon:yes stop_codon:yes gene_type:complete
MSKRLTKEDKERTVRLTGLRLKHGKGWIEYKIQYPNYNDNDIKDDRTIDSGGKLGTRAKFVDTWLEWADSYRMLVNHDLDRIQVFMKWTARRAGKNWDKVYKEQQKKAA